MRAALCERCVTGVGSAALATIVEFDSIGLRYGTGGEVLRDLDFRLGAGQFYFLTVPSRGRPRDPML